MPRNIPLAVRHGSNLKATIFSNYILNNVSRHVYDEVGATGKQVSGVMVKNYSKKTVSCRSILGTTATQLDWSVEGRMARGSEWTIILSWSVSSSDYGVDEVEVTGEWDWLRVGCYISAGTNVDNPLITCTINCRKKA